MAFDSSRNNTSKNAELRLKKGTDSLASSPTQNSPLDFLMFKGSLSVKKIQPNGNIILDEVRLDFQFNPQSISDTRSVKYAVTNPIQSEQSLYQHINYGERTITFQLFFNSMEPPLGKAYVSSSPPGSKLVDNQFPALSKPTNQATQNSVGIAARKIPFVDPIGTGLGQVNRFSGKTNTTAKGLPARNVSQDIELLDSFLRGRGDTPPPILKFNWSGYFQSDWILTDLKLDTTMFQRSSAPLHVTADITLKEVSRETIKTVISQVGSLSNG